MKTDVVVIGGAGHVGLPLSIFLAQAGHKVEIFDISQPAVDKVTAGVMPFWEPGAEELLRKNLRSGNLFASTNPEVITKAEIVFVVIGTPVGSNGPDPNLLVDNLKSFRDYFRNGQLLVLRSTIFPGVTEKVMGAFRNWGLDVDVAFAPERIAEHRAFEELQALPQIVAGCSVEATKRVKNLFTGLGVQVLELEPKEAELAKLFSNSWRYIKFAVANQFFQIADNEGLDFEKIRKAMIHEYPRAADLPSAGFAAGPCLVKDSLQLSAFAIDNFSIGNAALLVNEGLTTHIVGKLLDTFRLSDMTVGLLGMSFKAGSDDIRSSLSYKLKREIRFHAKQVLTTDPMVSRETDDSLIDLEKVLELSDVLVVCTPHREYRELKVHKPVIDVWGIIEQQDHYAGL